jgi:hypothetical protein
MSDPFSPAAKLNTDVRNLTVVSILIVGLVVFYWLIGHTDRVVYLGPDHGQIALDNQVPLKTEPAGNYFIARNAIYTAMKSGCRYDLNYAPEFGRNRGATTARGRTKHIRSATLVDCP